MSDPFFSTPPDPGLDLRRRLLVALALIGAIALIAAATTLLLVWKSDTMATPADVIGAPVRAKTPEGDRIFVLTSQWKTWKPFTSIRSLSTAPTYTDLLIDVWAFDPASGKTVWTRRLEADRSGINSGRALLGADAGAVWVLAGEGVVGLSLKDGTTIADVARLEAANPQLRGLMPKEPDFYQFEPAAGLSLTAADGRRWRLDGASLRASPKDAEPGARAAFAPARWSGGVGTWMFHEKGLVIGERWLGVLSDAEAGKSRDEQRLVLSNAEQEPRGRLWSARIRKQPTHFGSRDVYEDFQPLPQGPEFVQAGLLSSGEHLGPPILLRGPDSVLVLHRDRLGDDGRWRVSRVAGPAGKVLWTAELEMKRLDVVMPGETTLAIQGSRPEPDPMRGPGQAQTTTDVDVMAMIDLASGRTSLHRFYPKPAK